MQVETSKTVFGSVWSDRIKQTVPALVVLIPYVHFDLSEDIGLEKGGVFEAIGVITVLALMISYITELFGDFIYYSLKNRIYKKSPDCNYRKLEDDYLLYNYSKHTLADALIQAFESKARVCLSFIAPSIFSFIWFMIVKPEYLKFQIPLLCIAVLLCLWRGNTYIKFELETKAKTSGNERSEEPASPIQ